MRYFVPDIDVRDDPSAPAEAVEKLGGLAEGLPATRRPVCSQCGGAMTLIAQFEHHSERLPLGRAGRRLYILMCENDPGMCASWELDSGANACLVVEPEDVDESSPVDPGGAPVFAEAIITGWLERDDGIDEALRDGFFSEAVYYGPELSVELVEQVPMETKLGSVPMWIQGAEEGPKGWHFLGQIDWLLRFRRAPRRIESWMSTAEDPDVAYWGPGPNFGDAGMAYLFADRRRDPPAVGMFWQCG